MLLSFKTLVKHTNTQTHTHQPTHSTPPTPTFNMSNTLISLIDGSNLLEEWEQLHDEEQNEELESMTLRELVRHAKSLGLSKSRLDKYGSSSSKRVVMSAIRDLFLLNKIVTLQSGSSSPGTAQAGCVPVSDTSGSDSDEDDSVMLETLRREKALKEGYAGLKKERAKFVEEKKTFEAASAAVRKNIVDKAKDKIKTMKKKVDVLEKSLSDARAGTNTSMDQLFYDNKELCKKLKGLTTDLQQAKSSSERFKSQFESQEATLTLTKSNLDRVRTECSKRKRESEQATASLKRAKVEKERAISYMGNVLRHLKGEQYWTYSCPHSLTGANAKLWKKFKCKRMVNGTGFSSDVLKVDDAEPKWDTLSEVVASLCASL